jgi:hypothetical protein
MNSTDIVAYAYNAETFCPACIVAALPTGDGQAFDGWDLALGASPMSTEANLDEIAAAFGIDRYDESTFDTSEFPKVELLSSDDQGCCDRCGEEIS